MTIGDYNAMLVYGVQCLFSLMSFSSVLLTILMSTTSAKRIHEVLIEEPTIKNPNIIVGDFPYFGGNDYDMLSLYGVWGGERATQRTPLHHGVVSIRNIAVYFGKVLSLFICY